MEAESEPRWLTWVWALSLLVAAAGVGLAAWGYLFAVNHPDPPALTAAERPETAPAAQPSSRPSRVVWIVLDGLRLDTSRRMPFLQGLRARGFDGVGESPLPSLSRPTYCAMATGAPPVRTGVRNNSFPGAVPLDTIFDRAKAGGLETAGIANLSWWNELFGRSFDTWRPATRLPELIHPLLDRTLGSGAELVLAHLVDLDRVGHTLGAGAEYERVALELDAELARGLASLDLGRDVVLITSDHGHRTRGGHGGPEPEVVQVPLVLAGKGIRAGGGELGPVAGIAPTIALLLGIELPRDASAKPMIAVLDASVLGSAYLDQRLTEISAHQSEYERRLHGRNARTELAIVSDWPARRVLALLIVVSLAAAVWQRAKRLGAQRGLLAVPLVGLGVLSVLELWDLPVSFSAIVEIDTFTSTLAAGTLTGVVLYVAAVHFLARAVHDQTRARAVRFQLRAGAIAYLAVAPVLWLAVGYSHRSELPPPLLMFLPLPAAFVGGVAACLLAAVSLTPLAGRARE